MKITVQKSLHLSLILSILLLSGCSSNNVLSTSEAHTYNKNFGLIENYEVDRHIHQEILAQNLPTQIEMPIINDPSITTELVLDPDAVTKDEYVQVPPIITYKYEFDSNFYNKAEWRSREN
jgi:hypothetical protein